MSTLLSDPQVSAASPNLLDDLNHARMMHQILHTAWCEAYRVRHLGEAEAEAERITKGALARVTSEAKLRFGNNSAHPNCDYCLTVSVFGGPGHEPSSFCRSGKRPHCTCDSCY
jgi:hypothetical protein